MLDQEAKELSSQSAVEIASMKTGQLTLIGLRSSVKVLVKRTFLLMFNKLKDLIM